MRGKERAPESGIRVVGDGRGNGSRASAAALHFRNLKPELDGQCSAAQGAKEGAESARPAGNNGGLCLPKEDIAFLAQAAVDEWGLTRISELAEIDPELAGAAEYAGVAASLRFRANGANGSRLAGGSAVADSDEPVAAIQDSGLAGRADNCETSEEEAMFRRICTECFRIGTGSPFIGGCRSTLPKLQSGLNRRLNGREHKLFRKCWDRMAAEGAIVFNSNRSAASLNPYTAIRDPVLRGALDWAAAENRKSCGQH